MSCPMSGKISASVRYARAVTRTSSVVKQSSNSAPKTSTGAVTRLGRGRWRSSASSVVPHRADSSDTSLSIYMYALAAACESLGQLRSRCAPHYRHIAAPRNTVSHSMITNTQQFTGKAAYSLSSYSVVLGARQWGWGSVAGDPGVQDRLPHERGQTRLDLLVDVGCAHRNW
jgi:hypothetical protein